MIDMNSTEFWNGFLVGTVATLSVVALVLYILGSLVGF